MTKDAIVTQDLSIISKNTTSALDAIQVLLGTTVGNQRLMVMDYGKHNYTLFNRHHDTGWKLKLKARYYGDEKTNHDLEISLNSLRKETRLPEKLALTLAERQRL